MKKKITAFALVLVMCLMLIPTMDARAGYDYKIVSLKYGKWVSYAGVMFKMDYDKVIYRKKGTTINYTLNTDDWKVMTNGIYVWYIKENSLYRNKIGTKTHTNIKKIPVQKDSYLNLVCYHSAVVYFTNYDYHSGKTYVYSYNTKTKKSKLDARTFIDAQARGYVVGEDKLQSNSGRLLTLYKLTDAGMVRWKTLSERGSGVTANKNKFYYASFSKDMYTVSFYKCDAKGTNVTELGYLSKRYVPNYNVFGDSDPTLYVESVEPDYAVIEYDYARYAYYYSDRSFVKIFYYD